MPKGERRIKGAPALPGAGRKPNSATIRNDTGVMITHVATDGTANIGRGHASISRVGMCRLITLAQEDGSEIRIMIF